MISSPESPVPSPDSILPLFVTAQSNLLSIALACDDALPTRLEANAVAAASRVASAVLSLGVAVEQCIPIFTSSARQRMRVADKRLGMKEDELADSVKTIQSSLQHLSVDRCVVEDVEDTMHCINDVFMGTGTLSPTSVLLSPARLGLMRCVDEAFHLQAAIDTDNSRVSHAPWFTRGEVNSVSITLVDTAGDSVHGVTADDVVCTFEGDDMVGWSTVPTVLVDTDTVLLTVALSLDCSNSASLHAHICGAYFIVLLTVRCCSHNLTVLLVNLALLLLALTGNRFSQCDSECNCRVRPFASCDV